MLVSLLTPPYFFIYIVHKKEILEKSTGVVPVTNVKKLNKQTNNNNALRPGPKPIRSEIKISLVETLPKCCIFVHFGLILSLFG